MDLICSQVYLLIIQMIIFRAPYRYKDCLSVFPVYRNSHCKDEMVMRLSYLYNENPYTGRVYLYNGNFQTDKAASLYWDGPQGSDSIQRWWCLTNIGNPIVEIRRPSDRLISTIGIPILVRWHLYIESASGIHWVIPYDIFHDYTWCLMITLWHQGNLQVMFVPVTVKQSC